MLRSRQQLSSLMKNVHHAKSNRQQNALISTRNTRFHGSVCCGTKCDKEKISILPLTTHSSSNCSSILHLPEHYQYGRHLYSSDTGSKMTEAQIKRVVDSISEKFSEALELMNDARASSGTVYFSEDVIDTRAQVEETLGDYTKLLSQLDDQQRKRVIQTIGLKMEELKAQMSLLEELAKE